MHENLFLLQEADPVWAQYVAGGLVKAMPCRACSACLQVDHVILYTNIFGIYSLNIFCSPTAATAARARTSESSAGRGR